MEESPRSPRCEVLPPEDDPPAGGALRQAGRPAGSHRHRSRRRAARRRRMVMFWVAAVVLWCATFVIGLLQGARDHVAPPPPPRPIPTARAAVPSLGSLRGIVPTVFPYSVVAGGVRSPEETRAAIARDAVVAAHYAGFRVADARLAHVSRARRVHVSYRIGDRVYWTRRTVALGAGEAVLTDGTTEIRARCGNRIADEVLGETSEAEPSEEVFDLPILVARDLEPEPILPSRPFAPMLFAPTAWSRYGPQTGTQRYPPERIPEPATLALLALGAGALTARALRRRGK